MSDFIDMLVDMLPVHSELQKSDNQLRVVLDKTVGAYMDEHTGSELFDELFLTSASGGWLDAHGRDYGVPRRLGESDDDYRTRLMIGPLEEFTINTVYELYDLQLMTKPTSSDNLNLTLLSDNHFLNNKYYVDCSDEVWDEIDKKFLTTNVLWRYP